MIDLTPIKPWISDETIQHSQQASCAIGRIGFEEWFKSQLEIFCNCTKTFKDGHRVTQTNDIRYNYELTTTVQMIEVFGEDKKDEYYEKLLEQHKINLEFEAEHGLEYDSTSLKKPKTSNKTTKKKLKQTSIDLGDKPKKETVAERKLKAHAIKINALTFKPKNINNGNTL